MQTWPHFLNWNPFAHTHTFWHICSRQLFKTLWQKVKLLLIGYFIFYHNTVKSIQLLYFHIFALLFSQKSAADLLYVGKGLTIWTCILFYLYIVIHICILYKVSLLSISLKSDQNTSLYVYCVWLHRINVILNWPYILKYSWAFVHWNYTIQPTLCSLQSDNWVILPVLYWKSL